jgi:hypothetical protein
LLLQSLQQAVQTVSYGALLEGSCSLSAAHCQALERFCVAADDAHCEDLGRQQNALPLALFSSVGVYCLVTFFCGAAAVDVFGWIGSCVSTQLQLQVALAPTSMRLYITHVFVRRKDLAST